MRKKSYRNLKINEIFYNKKHNIDLNKKLKIPRIINSNSSINNINLHNDKTEISNNNINNNIRNLPFKTKIIKILSEREKSSNRNEKNKNKNKFYKKLSYNRIKTENDQFFKDNSHNLSKNEKIEKKEKNENKYFIQSYQEFKRKKIKQVMSPRNEKKEIIKKNSFSHKKAKELLSDEKEKEIIVNKTINELDYKKMENNNLVNLKSKKGIFTFNTFLKNKNMKENKNENEMDLESEKKFFDNRLKEKLKIKFIGQCKNVKNEHSGNNTTREIKNKNNNIILLNFRSDKRKILLNQNRISTSIDKDISARNGALKILELLRKQRSEKIILKQKQKEKEDKVKLNKKNKIKEKITKKDIISGEKNNKNQKINISNNNIIINEDKQNINIIENKEKNNKNIEKIEINNKNDNENKSIDKEHHSNKKSIFNEIIEEIKQEKNYIQKIVHRKLIEGVHELKKNKSFNYGNKRYNTETFNELSIKTFKNQNTILYNIYKENNNNQNNEDNTLNINIYQKLVTDKKDKNNNRYLNINLDNYKKRQKSYEKYKTYTNSNLNNDSNDEYNNKIKNENHRVKIKKIKLDKLRNKMQSKNSNSFKGENININLNLNNKIININNTQKIYIPKKVSITKRPSFEMMSIPIFYSHSPDFKNNSLGPSIYSKNEEFSNSTYINNIKPFNEIKINDLYKTKNYNRANTFNNINSIIINSNKNTLNNNLNTSIKSININTTNINIKEKNKSILYSKAKIKRMDDTSFKQNLSTSRCKTIKYVKKSNNKFERVGSRKKLSSNKVLKIQEMKYGGLNKRYSDKNINNLDKTQPIYFDLKSPFIKQNSFVKYRTYFSSDIDDLPNINLKDCKNQNEMNISKLYSNNIEDHDDTLSSKKFNTNISKLAYNSSYDKIINNITSTDDIINENNDLKFEQILNLLIFEDLLIIEDKLNMVLIALEKGNKTSEECFDLWNYFFSSGLKSKLEQIFKYFIKESENMKYFVNYSLIFLMICYDFAVNSITIDIDNNFSLNEIGQVIYTNLLIIINLIKSRISFENKDNYNIRLIELSKIEIKIKNKLSNIDNDYLFIKEILTSNNNLLIKRITSIIESNIINNISNLKYNSEFFTKIKNSSLDDFNNFFLENILKEDYIGCSILATTYLKRKENFIQALVPYLRAPNKKKYSLVLDLDETLIHFKVNKDENGEGVLKLRPGVFSFLEKIREFYEVILFTEASEAYAKLMMEAFSNKDNKILFDYKLYRQHTIIIGQDFIKDLSRIGRPLDKTIIIDNIAQNFKMQKSNGILIKPFLGEDQNDQALNDLIPILTNIARDEIDVRNGLMKYRDEILTKISSNLFRRNKNK